MGRKRKKFRLYLHPAQQEIFSSPARYKVIASSRRFGKSRLLLTAIINKSLNYQGVYDKASPPVCLLAMPTLKQARSVHWIPLCNLLEGHPLVSKIYKSDFRINIKGKKPDILLRGLNEDSGDGVRGLKLYFAGIDEIQDVKPIAWTEVIRPALADTPNSSSYICGTPKGLSTFFHELFMFGETSDLWESFHKNIYDNPYLNPVEIENVRLSLPERVFQQEFMADWLSFKGVIFSELKQKHLIPNSALPVTYDKIGLGVDWGDTNPSLVVIGKKGLNYFIIDCWCNPNQGVAIEQHVHNRQAIDFVKAYGITEAFADPSQPGRILSLRKAGVPKLASGYNRVSEGNGVINTLLFQDRLYVAESCKEVWAEMSAYHRKSKDGILFDEPAPHQNDHYCDAARYYIASLEHRNINNLLTGQIISPNPNPIIPTRQGLYTTTGLT